MRQVKRLFYMVLLNVVISAITVIVVLELWQKDHPPVPAGSTPAVIIVTAPGSAGSGGLDNNVVSDITGANIAGVPVTVTVQPSPTAEMFPYQIQEGDTLGALAVRFKVSVSDIMSLNNLSDPDSLYIGQIIYIPTAPLPTATSVPTNTKTPATSTPKPSATLTPRITPTSTPTKIGQEAQLIIDTVIGAGALGDERVVLRRTGAGELALAGWRLDDGVGNQYIFPALTLYKDGAISLYTHSGQNTVVDLFWGLTSPIWKPGKIVSLYDAKNVLRSTYHVP